MAEHAMLIKTSETKGKSVSIKPKENFPQTMDSPLEQMLSLQQTIGNREVQRLIRSGKIQAKLTIDKPNDKYEQEADRMADRVMKMPEPGRSLVNDHPPLFQKKSVCPECPEKEKIQTKPLAEQITPLVQQTRAKNSDTKHKQQSILTTSNQKLEQPVIQRTVHEGTDHGGRYEIDDEACSLAYHQNWFFTFQTTQTEAERTRYMKAAKQQIEDVWSGKFAIRPDRESCPCYPGGINVSVVMHPFERNRQGRGFTIIVTPRERRGFTNQPLRRIDLGTRHERPVPTGVGTTQQRIAHEFGHTIGLTDEYHGWASLFNTEGSRDNPSIMHSGDEVRPRHYQHFADLVNLEIGSGCTYNPHGRRMPEFENPVNRFSGLPFPFLPQNADFVIGLNFDRRISNRALLGLVYPTTGAMSIWNPEERTVLTGPTVGLRLNQLAHPLYVNLRTGALFDPANPRSVLNLNIPISAELGIRGRGFQVGANYTGVVEVLNSGRWTHIVGVGLSIDLP